VVAIEPAPAQPQSAADPQPTIVEQTPPATVAAETTPQSAPPTEAGQVWAGAEPTPKAATTAPTTVQPSVSQPKPAEAKTVSPTETQAAVAESSKPASIAAQALPEPSQPDTTSATPIAEVKPPVLTALASAPQPILSGHRLLVAGLLLLGVAAGLLWLIVRRSRATATATSLITQSFDRDKDGPTTR
jgi:cobalamin biosynthesis Mg chelatase CobN